MLRGAIPRCMATRIESSPSTEARHGTAQKPRLLYFNGPWDYLGDRIIAAYIEPFRRLLDQDFEVVSIEGDADFAQEVERHRPEMVLFHSGTESRLEKEVTITHTSAYREIPRAGYIYRDPMSPSRTAAMNRLRDWGVQQIFTCFRPSDSPIPFFEDTIYLPWWVDDRVFRDYGEKKTIPISLTGSGWLSDKYFYVWRHPILQKLLQYLPVYHVPVFETHQSDHIYIGERYARLLNRSQFSGGCGSVSRFVTLKPLEIPASRCCLITEETQAFKALGFVDGENCVFATPENVATKVQALLDDPVRLHAITDAGYALVHGRHTQRQRRHFAEWFSLRRVKRPDQRIVQTNPFAPPQLIDANEPRPSYTFPSENPLAERLVEGYRLIGSAKWKEALDQFDWVLRIIGYVAEARLGSAICHMRLGRPAAALEHLMQNAATHQLQGNYRKPDVVNLSFLAAALVGTHQVEKGASIICSLSDWKHPALNALAWLLACRFPRLVQVSPIFAVQEGDESCTVETVHMLPSMSFAQWLGMWTQLLQPSAQTLPIRRPCRP